MSTPILYGYEVVSDPYSQAGKDAEMRYGENIRLYDFKNSNAQDIWLREDMPGPGQTRMHFNGGPAPKPGETMNLESHHWWGDDVL